MIENTELMKGTKVMRRDGFRRLQSLLAVVLLLLTLATLGCAGMQNLQYRTSGGSTMMDCGGDLPSPYAPYCRPVHN